MTLPVYRTLGETVPVDYTCFTVLKKPDLAPDDLELDVLLGHCLTDQGFQTSDSSPMEVMYSAHPVQLQLPTGKLQLQACGTFSLSETTFFGYVSPGELRLLWDETRRYSIEGDTAYYIALLIGLSQQVEKSLDTTLDAYPVSDSDCRHHVWVVLTPEGATCVPRR